MLVSHEYRISKSELFNSWTLTDIFDALEYLDVRAAQEEAYSKHMEEERKSK